MTACLPPNLLALFAPREPIPYLPPIDKTLAEKKRAGYGGIGSFLPYFEHPKDILPPVRVETRDERKERKKRERQEMMTYKLEQELARWLPADNPEASSDPYKTLFVARLNYETSEGKIRREFEQYGPVAVVKMVGDKKSGKSKGYAFVEFENEQDMHSAYKHADGKRIDGRRITVDVERGRTVKGWKPRRLGGGRGGRKTGATDPDKPRPQDNERPAGGGPIRNERDRGDRDRPRDTGRPYGDRPPMGGRGGFGDRNGGGGPPDRNNAGFFEQQQRNGGYQDRNFGGGQFGSREFGDRGNQEFNRVDRPPFRDDRHRDRGDDRNRDRDRDRGRDERGGRDRERDRDVGNGDRDRRRRN